MVRRPAIILASSSPFRRQLLEQLGVPFRVQSPRVDEGAQPGETPVQLVRRLSEAKARAVAATLHAGLVIGSDQVAVIDDEVLGKPGNHAAAVAQLSRASGREVRFLTGLCLVNAASAAMQLDVAVVEVGFQTLTPARIEAYLRKDQPYQCAGSIRAEATGPGLFRYVRNDDPSALIGLPLVRLCAMLAAEGFDVIDQPAS